MSCPKSVYYINKIHGSISHPVASDGKTREPGSRAPAWPLIADDFLGFTDNFQNLADDFQNLADDFQNLAEDFQNFTDDL